MAEPHDATPFLPERRTLSALREAATECRGCHLWRPATQVVFGQGLKRSRVMLVGEQPGDKEDLAGRPFVGPAGRELDRGLEAAGIARDEAYVTNVVKHFKFEERGRRRIHQTPKRFEIDACRPWLGAELEVVRPEALVLLGATAAKAIMGSSFRVTQHRGELLDCELAPIVTATIHPSSILRQRDDEARYAERESFAEDLRVVASALALRPSTRTESRHRHAYQAPDPGPNGGEEAVEHHSEAGHVVARFLVRPRLQADSDQDRTGHDQEKHPDEPGEPDHALALGRPAGSISARRRRLRAARPASPASMRPAMPSPITSSTVRPSPAISKPSPTPTAISVFSPISASRTSVGPRRP